MIATHVIASPDDPRCAELPALLEAMYAEEAAMGSPMVLAPDGGTVWLKGAGAGLERFGRIVVATDADGTVVGFAHGAVRLQPAYLSGGPVGSITHVYVAPAHRRGGHARAMVALLAEWFAMRRVERTELTVVAGNAAAAGFWKAIGFSTMLHLMARS
ncbi:MAG: GNAT family N-acetyltransferase [Flavobacteriales bacterium]|jgi:ribosomal protein S18 acetylase RimI-like enzyme|nr:GNAT family N-acetyltransferase [Flavobacteriales bacterium]